MRRIVVGTPAVENNPGSGNQPSGEAKQAIDRTMSMFRSGTMRQTIGSTDIGNPNAGKFGMTLGQGLAYRMSNKEDQAAKDRQLLVRVGVKQISMMNGIGGLLRQQNVQLAIVAENTRITYEKVQDLIDEANSNDEKKPVATDPTKNIRQHAHRKEGNRSGILGLLAGAGRAVGGLLGAVLGGIVWGIFRIIGGVVGGLIGGLARLGLRGLGGFGASASRLGGSAFRGRIAGGVLRSAGRLGGMRALGAIGLRALGILGGPIGWAFLIISVLAMFPEQLKAISNSIMDFFREYGGKFVEWFTDAGTAIKDAYEAVKTKVRDAYEWVKENISTIFDTIFDKIVEWYNKVKSIIFPNTPQAPTPREQALAEGRQHMGGLNPPNRDTGAGVYGPRMTPSTQGEAAAGGNGYRRGEVPQDEQGREEYIYNGLRERGMDHERALGMTANIMHESRGNPAAVNPNDGGRVSAGLLQWRQGAPGRPERYEEYVAANGHAPNQGSMDEQLDYIVREMQTRGEAARIQRETAAQQQRDPNNPLTESDWAAIYSRAFIRPGRRELEAANRAVTARQIGERLNRRLAQRSDRENNDPNALVGLIPQPPAANTATPIAPTVQTPAPQPVHNPEVEATLQRLRSEQRNTAQNLESLETHRQTQEDQRQAPSDTPAIIQTPVPVPTAGQQRASLDLSIPSVRNDDPVILRAIRDDLSLVV